MLRSGVSVKMWPTGLAVVAALLLIGGGCVEPTPTATMPIDNAGKVT